MRLKPIHPAHLGPDLRPVHDTVTALMARTQDRIVVVNHEGALVGPFAAMLHFPHFGVPALTLLRALADEARLPARLREVAILTVASAAGARYELYAHEITAGDVGLSAAQVAALASGGMPEGLDDGETVARDIARVLSTGGILPASTYARAVELLGKSGVGELVFLIGGYFLIAVVLNAFDVPVPDD